MTGVTTQAQMGSFLTALRLRHGGETVEENNQTGASDARKSGTGAVDEYVAKHALDTCGTGGDSAGYKSTSQAGAGEVAAAAGAAVAKHGGGRPAVVAV